jgi:hypothetical protein
MKFLIILAAVSVFFMIGMFLFDDKVISNLPDDNRFKKWWRKNLIGEMNNTDL